MKKIIAIWILELCLCWEMKVLAQPPSRPDSNHVSYLTVYDVQDGLKIFLDGKEIGFTPLSNYPILPGEHRLMVRSPKWPSLNSTDYDTIFVAQLGDTLRISPTFIQSIRLTSIPYGVAVKRGNEMLGYTPLLISLRPYEVATILFEKEGYEPLQQELLESAATVVLKPDLMYWQQKQENDRRKQNRIKWYRRGLYGSIVLGAISGMATIHYRGKGNDAYAAYLETANPTLMDRYYNRARHYDRLAGASYAIFEVSFIMSGYFFLKSRK